MTKIFKQLARHWAVCLVVFALLFVQAYCDLALPDYTSKIVDTGIQQGGIESPLPQTVRQSTLDALSLLMNEEDAQKLQNAYQYYLQDDGVLQLRSDLTEDERTALEDAVTTPDMNADFVYGDSYVCIDNPMKSCLIYEGDDGTYALFRTDDCDPSVKTAFKDGVKIPVKFSNQNLGR